MRRLSPAMLGDGNVAGYRPLREAIANYLGTSRGVNCSPDQVVVVSGAQQALDLIARIVLKPGDAVWMEDPGYIGAIHAFRNAGARLIPVRVDERGFDPEIGRKACPDARAVYVTPGHQFPLGATMSLERRLALLSWARESGALIVEDDYDSEFRFTGSPIPALQGLARSEAVIFIGSFNKVMFPSLRLGYMVLPASLVDPFLAARFQIDRYPPGLSQSILCDFIDDGHFGRHLRRTRELYSAQLTAMHENARRYLDGLLEIPSIQAGLITPALLRNGMTSQQAEQTAAKHGIESMALDRFVLSRTDIHGLLLGFAAFNEGEIREGVIALATALGSCRPDSR
jgi:GntR family transcriptional regulator/MocR family aminotransferase